MGCFATVETERIEGSRQKAERTANDEIAASFRSSQ